MYFSYLNYDIKYFYIWKLDILCRFRVYVYKVKYIFFLKKQHIKMVPFGTVFTNHVLFKKLNTCTHL